MKALTLTQPWALLVAIGAKHYETRSWSTKYRGPIAIHAGKRIIKFAEWPQLPTDSLLRLELDEMLSLRGNVIAIANLIDVIRITADNAPAAPELWYGDFTPGRYMWKLENIVRIKPEPATGKLSLWEWERPPILYDHDSSKGFQEALRRDGK